MKISRVRKVLALAIAVLVAVLAVGLLGQVPNWGEVGPVAFAGALLGVWVVGSVAWRP